MLVERFSPYGGTEAFAMRLVRALTEAGTRVEVVCARTETEAPPGVVLRVVGRPPGPRGLKLAWFAWRASRLAASGRYGFILSLAPTTRQDLSRVSGGPQRVFERLSLRAQPPGLRRLAKRVRRMLSPGHLLTRAIQKRQFAPGSKLVAVSHRVRDWLLREHPGLNPDDVRVVYNKPDLSRYRPPQAGERAAARRDWNIPEGSRAMVLAGTNFDLKGVATAIAALAKLPGEFLLLVAGGRNPGRHARLARDLGVADRVRFLGRVDDMPHLYRAADLFVLPSFYDTCSNAVLEALASGLPAISSADNGSSFFLPERWVVQDPGDAAELAEAIRSAAAEEPPEPFAWPENVECGIEPYVRHITEALKP